MSPRARKPNQSSEPATDLQQIIPAQEFLQQLRPLSQADYTRFCDIFDRVYQIRKLLNLHDLDTARLFKRFFDEPAGIGDRIVANVLGLIARHYGWTVGTQIDRLDPRMQEFRAVVIWSSPLNLDAFDRPGGPSPADVEALLQPLLAFPCPDWSTSQDITDYAKAVAEGRATGCLEWDAEQERLGKGQVG